MFIACWAASVAGSGIEGSWWGEGVSEARIVVNAGTLTISIGYGYQ